MALVQDLQKIPRSPPQSQGIKKSIHFSWHLSVPASVQAPLNFPKYESAINFNFQSNNIPPNVNYETDDGANAAPPGTFSTFQQ